MKRPVITLCTILAVLTACEDGNDSDDYPAACSKIQLSEESPYEANVPTVTTVQTFLFSQGRLTDYTTVQGYSIQGEQMSMKNATSVTYNERQAVVADDFGNVSTYLLDNRGYAISCTRRESVATRTYSFSYFTTPEGNCYLEKITEQINGKVYASINIDYSNRRELRIARQVDTHTAAYTATTSANNETDSGTGVPSLFLSQLYPLSLHTAAFYGKLLGEAFPMLIERIVPDGKAESKEVTEYAYTFDKHNALISCKEVTNSYGTNYVRTVNYVIE